jgi:hypothetical protein
LFVQCIREREREREKEEEEEIERGKEREIGSERISFVRKWLNKNQLGRRKAGENGD